MLSVSSTELPITTAGGDSRYEGGAISHQRWAKNFQIFLLDEVIGLLTSGHVVLVIVCHVRSILVSVLT